MEPGPEQDRDARAQAAWDKRQRELDTADKIAEDTRREKKRNLIAKIEIERFAAAERMVEAGYGDVRPGSVVVGYDEHRNWYGKRSYELRTETRYGWRLYTETELSRCSLLVDGSLVEKRVSRKGEFGLHHPSMVGIHPLVLADMGYIELRHLLRVLQTLN